MRPVLLCVLAFVVIGTIAGFIAGRSPFLARFPRQTITDLDLERRALRYEHYTVTDSKGGSFEHEILLLGPAGRIYEPWLQVGFMLDRIELIDLQGNGIRVPDGTATAVWDEAASAWHFSAERFDPARLPNVRGKREHSEAMGFIAPAARSLPDALREVAPERGALIDRAFPPGGERP